MGNKSEDNTSVDIPYHPQGLTAKPTQVKNENMYLI